MSVENKETLIFLNKYYKTNARKTDKGETDKSPDLTVVYLFSIYPKKMMLHMLGYNLMILEEKFA